MVKINPPSRKGKKRKMENEFEYYLIDNDDTPSVPLLKPDGNQSTLMLTGIKPIEPLEEPMKLCLRKDIPVKPRMVDHHSLPESVFSQKVYDVIQAMNLYGLQLLPAVIRGKNNEYYEDYWVAYVYNEIIALDMDNSEYDIDEDDGDISNISRFFLDNKKLSKIPFEKRMVFRLEEDPCKHIYHKTIVDVIMSVNPVGVKFYPIQEWYEGIQFKN